MRRSIVIVALLAAPFLASVSQGQARPNQAEQRSQQEDKKCEKSQGANVASKAGDKQDNGKHLGWDKGCAPAPQSPPPAPAPAPDPTPAPPPPAPAPAPAPAPDPTPAPPPPPTGVGEIHGLVFIDLDGSNAFEAGEPTISGWSIELSGPVSSTVMSDGNGNYSFGALPDGDYTVCARLVPGFTPVFPTSGPTCAGGFGWTLSIPAAGANAAVSPSGTGAVINGVNFGYRM